MGFELEEDIFCCGRCHHEQTKESRRKCDSCQHYYCFACVIIKNICLKNNIFTRRTECLFCSNEASKH